MHIPCRSLLPLLRFPSSFDSNTHIYSFANTICFSCSISQSQDSRAFLWFPCCTLARSRSIYNHRFWGLYLLVLRHYNYTDQSLATRVSCPFLHLPFRFLWDDYTVEVKLNDYLDIICPHYPQGEVPLLDAERYVLYMVEREDYDSCKPQSYDQMRWECGHPFAPHAPEKFSEKFQRFTPFTLGKEFRQGESYYYICKCCHGFLPFKIV